MTDEGIEVNAGDDATYREVLETLLQRLAVSAEVTDERLARKKTRLRVRGKAEEILRILLRGKDFIIVYQTTPQDIRISRVVVIGESGKDNIAAIDALARVTARKQPGEQSGQKPKSALLPQELRSVAINSTEYMKRLARQNALFANLDGAYAQFMDRMARASAADTQQEFDRGIAGQNRSAGLPRLFVAPPPQSVDRYTAFSMAYTGRMAARDLTSLMRVLTDD